ncbi:hypothetical protein HPB51_022790 [Rhipicephalus microplus]|uniref:Fibronectin type-III domain-containing protein n=1 Tax=Rhipicephalus microplus TaxID=6941 RepID=A0A9J6ECH5_RHIMP|nr:hypothetical protein HPB51_022790 [Rhipicephalus microplus]
MGAIVIRSRISRGIRVNSGGSLALEEKKPSSRRIWRPALVVDHFDYYLVEVTGSSHEDGDVGPYRVGLCANGSIVDAHQEQVTCDHIEPCTNISFRIRTHAKGPPQRTSLGVTLDGIFVPGQGPDSPRSVLMYWSTPSLSLLSWRPPDEGYGTVQEYRVRMCQRYWSCDVQQEMAGCEEYPTSNNELRLNTRRGTRYCVLVSSRMRCGGQVVTGRPVVTEVMAPLHKQAFPRVTNVTQISAGNRSFTVSWERPKEKFDYYRVEVSRSGTVVDVGSCAKGTIIDAKKARLTCDNVEDCSNVTFKIRAYNRGPPERGSFNAAFKDIFIPGQAADAPNNVSILGISPSLSRLQWEQPDNVSDTLRDYTVRICPWYWPCDAEPDLTSCFENRTTENWLDFETTERTPYCVQVKANTLCGDQVIAGLPATAEVIVPFLGEEAEK